ncbi:HvfX family Cu-binding RiPP maturation protein [Thiohalophilus thiocyanatoxydans]|uniref:DoxX-like protein n=1 Tax=Thiohalophilus thiocyanatoxydans TaxID=381308 RepID=A0A4V3H4N9_9GAMM|nr:DoxX family protein [Thiohalophilus thiocyanatoxydans]TDY03925.1 DoxX-like protein [Thiohalophilus thiocyanatoxydans]
MNFLLKMQGLLDKSRQFDFLAPLLLRLFLAPIFILAGYGKLTGLENTAYYFGEMLGLPAPMLMAVLAGAAEFFGGIAILIGVATRWFAIPLMITMIMAATTAHWENGWHALPETTLTVPWEWRTDMIEGAVERRDVAREILKEHGNYNWLTEHGSITILKNGIEFAATYFIMLLVLFFHGAGRYASLDYWIGRKLNP